MSDDGSFDYHRLTKEQIEYAVAHIDRSQFPQNYAKAEAALAARISGRSPEPAPLLDKATDARYTFWMERALGVVLIGYGGLGLVYDDLPIPMIGHLGQVNVYRLHGPSEWLAVLALFLAASIPFFGGLRNADPLAIRPRFRIVYRLAIVLIVLALAVSRLGVAA